MSYITHSCMHLHIAISNSPITNLKSFLTTTFFFCDQDKSAPKLKLYCKKKTVWDEKLQHEIEKFLQKSFIFIFFSLQLILDNAQKVLMRYFPWQLSNTHAISFLFHYSANNRFFFEMQGLVCEWRLHLMKKNTQKCHKKAWQ